MRLDPHRRAQRLVSDARIAGISPKDGHWLRGHLAECAECARYEQSVDGVVRGLRSFAFDVDPGMGERIQNAVATRARRPLRRWPWAVAAGVFLAIAAVPLYNGMRDARREEADALLMEGVENRVGRVVPLAMEPLLPLQTEESK